MLSITTKAVAEKMVSIIGPNPVPDPEPHADPGAEAPSWFGGAAQNVAPAPIAQVFFLLVYAVWWGFAWPGWGWGAFALAVAYAVFVVIVSVRNIRHAQQFENVPSAEGARIGKAMGILSAASYGPLWIAVIALAVFGQWRWIMPVVAAIIALHFFPLARIFNRKIDYVFAPIALAFALIGMWMAWDGQPWALTFAVASLGGAIATFGYSIYMLVSYRKLVARAGLRL